MEDEAEHSTEASAPLVVRNPLGSFGEVLALALEFTVSLESKDFAPEV